MERGERKHSQGKILFSENQTGIHYLRECLFSVFIDNIPDNKEEQWLRSLFSEVGKVLDCFIPVKWRIKSRSRFGFIRYKSLEEAISATRRWNGLVVGHKKLVVKLADNEGKPKVGWRNVREENRSRYDGGIGGGLYNKIWKAKSIHEDQYSKEEKSKSQKLRVSLSSCPEEEVWLRNCAVAELREFIPAAFLESELRESGVPILKIIPIGVKKVLIRFSKREALDACLFENCPTFLQRFSKFQRWREEETTISRTVWVGITGLPLNAWCDSNFRKIVASLGSYLRMEDPDSRLTDMSRARVLVESSSLKRLSGVVETEINGRVFEVLVCEECYLNGCELEPLWKNNATEGTEENLRSSAANQEGAKSSVRVESYPNRLLSMNKASLGEAQPPRKEEQGRCHLGIEGANGQTFEFENEGENSTSVFPSVAFKSVSGFDRIGTGGSDANASDYGSRREGNSWAKIVKSGENAGKGGELDVPYLKKSVQKLKTAKVNFSTRSEELSEKVKFVEGSKAVNSSENSKGCNEDDDFLDQLFNKLISQKNASKHKRVIKYARRKKKTQSLKEKLQKECISRKEKKVNEVEVNESQLASKTISVGDRLGEECSGDKEDISKGILKIKSVPNHKKGVVSEAQKKEKRLRKEARLTYLFAKKMGVARHDNEEEAIQQLLNLS